MIIKVFFKTEKGKKIPFNNQKEMNSFIYRTLGDNNKYHDTFSDYSISSIQGGKMFDKESIIFNEEPYIVITSNNMEFIGDMLNGLNERKYDFFGMTFDRVKFEKFTLNKIYDVVITRTPVIVKHNGRKISIDNTSFLEELKKNCIGKLAHAGITDDTFDIVLRTPEKAKTKKIIVGEVFNICTSCSMYVYGKQSTRDYLYNVGFGGSTGSGFGSIKVYG